MNSQKHVGLWNRAQQSDSVRGEMMVDQRTKRVRKVEFDRLARNRWSNVALTAFCVVALGLYQYFQVSSPAWILRDVASPDGLNGALVVKHGSWLLIALVTPFALFKAIGSSVISLDREAHELRWKRSLLGLPLPGKRISFEEIKRVIVVKSSESAVVKDNVNPAGGLTTRTLRTKTLEAELRDDSLSIVLWQGDWDDKLPKGLSPEGIASKLDWGYDKSGRAAVPRKRKRS